MVNKLNSGAYQAFLRERDDSIAWIPPVGRRSRQWSYLDSETKTKRAVLVADIFYAGAYSSLVEFQWRKGESFRLAVITRLDGVKIANFYMRELLHMLARKEGRWEHLKSYYKDLNIQLLKHTWPTVDDYCVAVKGILPRPT